MAVPRDESHAKRNRSSLWSSLLTLTFMEALLWSRLCAGLSHHVAFCTTATGTEIPREDASRTEQSILFLCWLCSVSWTLRECGTLSGYTCHFPEQGLSASPLMRMVREPAGNEWAQSSSKELTRAWDMARPREGQQRTQWRIQKWKQGYAREQSDTLSDLKAISHWLAWIRKSFLDLNLEWPSVILSVDFHPIVISWQLTMLVVTLWSMNTAWNIQYF